MAITLQDPLPDHFADISPEETDRLIAKCREELGDRVVILGHHYQRDEIIKWADHRGDSLKLSQLAGANTKAEYIVFCGVHFMAETADILTTKEQSVILPNLSAGCSMADMASIRQVEHTWSQLQSVVDCNVVPVTYVNSTAAIKAFVGRNNGACCTSSNAARVISWAFEQGEKLMFFPDQHLGRNTSVALGVDPDREMVTWDPALPLGGNSTEAIRQAKVILWKGHCSVHARFTTEQIAEARVTHSGVKVIVHPECSLDVVKAADASGSTEFIIQAISSSAPGTTWGVGTEINLVNRLARELPDRKIFCLDPVVCPCSTMYRIHPYYLLWSLQNILMGAPTNIIVVQEPTASDARRALDRMLSL